MTDPVASPAAAINFRDFGGAPSRFGGVVHRGRLYRSGRLCGMTPADQAAILALNVAVVGDLRHAGERRREPSFWPDALQPRILSHDEDRGQAPAHLVLMREPDFDIGRIAAFYGDYYRRFIFVPHYRDLFARIMTAASRSNGALLIHCTAGKDRTGMLAALLLDLLGADREAILADFLRSADAPGMEPLKGPMVGRLRRTHAPTRAEEIASAMLAVRRDDLDATFDAIAAGPGSVESYFREAGLDAATITAFRARFLSADGR